VQPLSANDTILLQQRKRQGDGTYGDVVSSIACVKSELGAAPSDSEGKVFNATGYA
jgi:hypothetical protein